MGSDQQSSVKLHRSGQVNEGLELDEVRIDSEIYQENAENIPMKKAIVVQNACKKFGSKEILSNLNMTVPKGSIYALLGASGCGKTTLLNCCMNIKKLDSGSIEIFGFRPGTPESGIPGSRVGYMPQDLSLFNEFTIREVIFYFGRIFGMSDTKIQSRMEFILKLLKLPDENMTIRDLSIWDYLNSLAHESNITILITTHYIEEANNSQMIGIMRNGRLLVENSPRYLTEKFSCTLDEIVMELCLKDENKDNSNSPGLELNVLPRAGDEKDTKLDEEPWENENSTFGGRIRALVIRNFIRMYRNIGFVFFLLFFPAMGVVMIALAVGGDIQNIKFGIVARETGGKMCPNTSTLDMCGGDQKSCHFFDHFEKNSMVWKYYQDQEMAQEDADSGKIWGFISVPQNFSEIFPYESENKLRVYIDATNQLITGQITKNIHDAWKNFTELWFENCQTFEVGKFEQPIIIDEIFGDIDAAFTEFVVPSFHLVMMIFMGVTLTGLVLILEKKSGMYERSLVAGVSQNEIIVSHFLSQSLIMIIQSIFALIIIFFAFNFVCRGPILGPIILTILQGTVGILLGFVISSICNEESSVLQLSISIVMPLVMVSGVIWPLEGMPVVLKYISSSLPSALAGSSIRSIMNRGWGFSHRHVWPGFVSSIGWIVGLTLLILILNRNANKVK